MRIGHVDLSERVLVVAEIGNNHEGDREAARELVRRAAACGAGGVKFQTFRTTRFVGPSDPARLARLRGFELPPEAFEELSRLARSLGLLFLSTPLDLDSARLLEPLVDAYKVASGDNTFWPLIEQLVRTGRPVILSTGLADGQDVARTLRFARERGPSPLALLHCVSAYPVPPEQANLRAVAELAALHPDVVVGYSDHVTGIEACVLAVALGARIVEKHFTLDHGWSDFRDHALSADPAEMTELVRRVEAALRMLGTGEKRVMPAEEPGRVAYRRSIAAGQDLPCGWRLELADLVWLRPAGGLAPGEEHRLVGRRLRRAVREGEWLRPEDVE